VKRGIGTDDLRYPLEFKTALHLSVLQFVQVAEGAIGSCLIRERPQSLGGLQLGCIRRQDMHMHPCRHLHLRTHMPAGTVEYQQDLLALARAHRVGELAELAGTRTADLFCGEGRFSHLVLPLLALRLATF
jgi:hypothetical protein